jgi:hypothetical protein
VTRENARVENELRQLRRALARAEPLAVEPSPGERAGRRRAAARLSDGWGRGASRARARCRCSESSGGQIRGEPVCRGRARCRSPTIHPVRSSPARRRCRTCSARGPGQGRARPAPRRQKRSGGDVVLAGQRRIGHNGRAGIRAGRRARGRSAGGAANRGATGERPRRRQPLRVAPAVGIASRARGSPRRRPAWPRSRWLSRPSLRSRSLGRTMLPSARRDRTPPSHRRPQPPDTRPTVVGNPARFATPARLPGAPASRAI